MKGYKLFDSDWMCRGKQYTCPGEFEEYCKPVICEQGMHFCQNLSECLNYRKLYDISFEVLPDGAYHITGLEVEEKKIAEVEAYGDIARQVDELYLYSKPNAMPIKAIPIRKYCTNRLRIIREISIEEAYKVIKTEIEGEELLKSFVFYHTRRFPDKINNKLDIEIANFFENVFGIHSLKEYNELDKTLTLELKKEVTINGTY